MNTNKLGKLRTIIPVLVSAFILFSCSSKEKDVLEPDKGGTTLKVNLLGTEQPNEGIKVAKAGFSNSLRTGIEVDSKSNNLENYGGFDASTSISTSSQKMKATTNISKKAVQPLDDNFQYRILIYDMANNLIQNIVAKPHQQPVINLNAGVKYKWSAISILNSTVPDVVVGTNKLSKADLINKDVVFANGEITTVAGVNNLDILLLHKTIQYEMILDAHGLFSKINNTIKLELGRSTSSSAFESLGQTGDFNVLDGTFSNLTDLPAMYPDYNYDDYSRSLYIYTANTTTVLANTLKLKMTAPSFIKADNFVLSFPETIVNVPNTTYTAASGTYNNIYVNLVESPVIVKGTKWARTNLRYEPTLPYYKYVFAPNNDIARPDLNEYWRWFSNTPNGSIVGQGDECNKVYPEGTWRLPTFAEVLNLGDAETTGSGVSKDGVGTRFYVQWTPAVLNTAYSINSQKLMLPVLGQYDETSMLFTGRDDSPAAGVIGANYWTSEGYISMPDGGVGAKSMYHTFDVSSGFYYSGLQNPAVVKYSGGSVADAKRLPIRCVRVN